MKELSLREIKKFAQGYKLIKQQRQQGSKPQTFNRCALCLTHHTVNIDKISKYTSS